MSKKKSYMNPNNSIMKEGIFDNLLKLLKFIPKSNTRDIKRDIANLNKNAESLEDRMNAELARHGSKEKIKLKRYNISNIMDHKR